MGYYNLISLMSPKSSLDPDAQAFITAATITDTTQKAAIDKLVTDLKGYGIWTKMKALYPFVGGTSTQHKFNLKDPRDLDAAFRLVFYGGVTHNSNGIMGNSTNAYADTLFKDSVSSTPLNKQISMYQRNIPLSDSGSSMGAFFQHRFYLNFSGTNYSTFEMPQSGFAVQSPQNGFFAMSKIASVSAKYYQNSLTPLSRTGGADLPSTLNYGLLASFSGVNSAVDYSSANLSFASIGDGISDSQYTDLKTAVQTFQTSLNRQVGVPIVADADAQAFLNAAVIEDVTQANAVNTLVTSLKGYGIWTKMKALYPFVGGTASSHKWNLKNPLDTDAAYRLTFNGGITHSANGIQGNAINGYYQTFINPSVVFSPASGGSQFIYSRTDLDTGVDLGALAFQPSLSRFYFISRLGANQTEFACLSGGVSTPTNVNSQGFFGITREPNAPNYYCVLNTNSVSTTDAYQEPNSTITGLGLIADTGQSLSWSARQQAMACIADGLTVAEAQNLRLANLTFQITLSRNV